MQRLALHVEQTPLAVIEFDIEGRIRAWNPAAENIFGYSSQEAFGKNWSFIVPAEIHDQIDKVWAAIVQQRGGNRSTNENITREGRKIYCEWFNTPLVDIEGRTIGVASLIQDVTERKETENTLRKNQEKFHNLFNNAEVGMFRSKLDGSEILEMNDRFLEIFGRSRQEMQNNPSLAHWAVPSEREEMVRRLHAEGNVREFECKMLTKHGEIKHCITSLRIYKEQGILEGSVLDISERKRAEEELFRSRKRLELAAKSAHLGVWDWDIVNNKMVWDDQMFRLYGIVEKPAAFGIEIWRNSLYPDDMAYAWEECEAALRGEKKYDIEFRVKPPDGTIRFLKADGIVLRDGDGKAVRMIGINRDITDLKLSEHALRESEERFRKIFEEASLGVVICSPSFIFEKANPAFCRMMGYSADELSSMTFSEITHPDYIKQDLENVKKVGRGEIPFYQTEKRYIRKNGETLWGSLTVSSIRDEKGPLLYYLSMVSDITERKRMEEDLQKSQKLESLGVLAGGIAHDFNNLMGGIFGYIDLANEANKEENVARYLAKALGTIDRARGLTQQLLTFSKGGAPVKKTDRFFPFVRDAALFALSGSSVSCRFDAPDDLRDGNFDRNQIGQVIDNIIINAQQAMPAGGTIEVSARNISFGQNERAGLSAGDYVRISIKDTGIGIPAEILPRIFDPFFTTKEKGHGLGLSTCYSIVNRHGGSISVESEPGKGSTFHVFFPAAGETRGNVEKANGPTA